MKTTELIEIAAAIRNKLQMPTTYFQFLSAGKRVPREFAQKTLRELDLAEALVHTFKDHYKGARKGRA